MNSRTKSLVRAQELHDSITEYMMFKKEQQSIIKKRLRHYNEVKGKILSYFNATENDWNDWMWQVNHRINTVEVLSHFIPLSTIEKNHLSEVIKTSRFAISPYYLALISDNEDPIKMICVPSINEVTDDYGLTDPMNEKNNNPAGSITRRYPDRLIINVTNQCAMYCRHCQRRRLIGSADHHTSKKLIDESIAYVRSNPELRDILLTGGDALLLSDNELEYIVKELRSIPHVEIIRIGSRTPVTIPMRITDQLVRMLKKYHPIYLNTHFNHYHEITPESKKACEKLSNHGINVGNQAVLLKGVNDHPYTMTLLNQMLLQARVRPYYIFHAKQVKGTTHFIPKLSDGLKIMEFMRGHTSGMAIPTYIMNAPNGLGKVPLLPDYIIKKSNDEYTLRTWENKTFIYKEKTS